MLMERPASQQFCFNILGCFCKHGVDCINIQNTRITLHPKWIFLAEVWQQITNLMILRNRCVTTSQIGIVVSPCRITPTHTRSNYIHSTTLVMARDEGARKKALVHMGEGLNSITWSSLRGISRESWGTESFPGYYSDSVCTANSVCHNKLWSTIYFSTTRFSFERFLAKF